MSPILYLFYNANLLEGCTNPAIDSSALGSIDDIGTAITGDTPEEKCRQVEHLHENQALPRAKKHASVFNLDKYVLMHFHRGKAAITSDEEPEAEEESPPNDDISVKLSGTMIRPKSRGKYRGVMLNDRLSWKQHIEYIDKKATSHLAVLGSLASST